MFKRIQVIARRYTRKLFLVLREIRLPGFRGMNLYDVLKFFWHGLSDNKFSLMAAAMAYNFFLALFPAIILIFIILSFTPVPDMVGEEIMNVLYKTIPAQKGSFVEIQHSIDEILKPGKGGGAQIGGIFLAAFLALRWSIRGVTAMTRAFTKNEEVFRNRNIFQTYGISLVILFVLGGIFLIAIAFQLVSQFGINYLEQAGYLTKGLVSFLLKAVNQLVSLFLLIFSISSIYHLGPATNQRWSFFSPGAFVASLLSMLTIAGFGWFFSNINSFNAIYGSLATIILLMLWFYYISIVLLIGFELNAAIDLASFHTSGKYRQMADPPFVGPSAPEHLSSSPSNKIINEIST